MIKCMWQWRENYRLLKIHECCTWIFQNWSFRSMPLFHISVLKPIWQVKVFLVIEIHNFVIMSEFGSQFLYIFDALDTTFVTSAQISRKTCTNKVYTTRMYMFHGLISRIFQSEISKITIHKIQKYTLL